MRSVEDSNCTEEQSYASSNFRAGHSAVATNGKSAKSATLAKLRGELRRLARSNSPQVIQFVSSMLSRYPELKDGPLVADGGDA